MFTVFIINIIKSQPCYWWQIELNSPIAKNASRRAVLFLEVCSICVNLPLGGRERPEGRCTLCPGQGRGILSIAKTPMTHMELPSLIPTCGWCVGRLRLLLGSPVWMVCPSVTVFSGLDHCTWETLKKSSGNVLQWLSLYWPGGIRNTWSAS